MAASTPIFRGRMRGWRWPGHPCAGLFVTGPAIDPAAWQGRDLAAHGVVAAPGGGNNGSFPGVGSTVPGDRWIALRRLVEDGDRLEADFAPAPPPELRFARAPRRYCPS